MATGLELAFTHAPLWSPTGDRIAFSWTDDPHTDDSSAHAHRTACWTSRAEQSPRS